MIRHQVAAASGRCFTAIDMLANLFGSLIIFLDQPFKIGDWIRSQDC